MATFLKSLQQFVFGRFLALKRIIKGNGFGILGEIFVLMSITAVLLSIIAIAIAIDFIDFIAVGKD